MHPVTPQPRAFVEPVLGRMRRRQLTKRIEDRALRRSATEGQPEQHRFVRPEPAETQNEPRYAEIEAPAVRRRRDDNSRSLCRTDERCEWTAIEDVQARTSPAPAADCEREHDHDARFGSQCGCAAEQRDRGERQR